MMNLTASWKDKHDEKEELYQYDKPFIDRHEAFLQEVISEEGQALDEKTRYIAILATLLGSQSVDLYKEVLALALDSVLTPVEAKEVVYQGVDYLGMGRVYPFLFATNSLMASKGIELPLMDQSTTDRDTRLEAGAQAQVDIFGPQMKDYWKGGHMNRWLAANCFGDYYTRKGLNLGQREMITFCFLAAQGGCEPQLKAHTFGNLNVGNDLDFLTKVVSQCVPYIGYPRSLNAMAVIQEVKAVLEENKK